MGGESLPGEPVEDAPSRRGLEEAHGTAEYGESHALV